MDRIGLVGLGDMGIGLAKNLLKSGFELFGYDVLQKRIDELSRLGGKSGADNGTLTMMAAARHFVYFRGFVLAMMLLEQARKCVTNIGQVCFFVERHISSWERFLSQYQWEFLAIQQRVVGLVCSTESTHQSL